VEKKMRAAQNTSSLFNEIVATDTHDDLKHVIKRHNMDISSVLIAKPKIKSISLLSEIVESSSITIDVFSIPTLIVKSVVACKVIAITGSFSAVIIGIIVAKYVHGQLKNKLADRLTEYQFQVDLYKSLSVTTGEEFKLNTKKQGVSKMSSAFVGVVISVTLLMTHYTFSVSVLQLIASAAIAGAAVTPPCIIIVAVVAAFIGTISAYLFYQRKKELKTLKTQIQSLKDKNASIKEKYSKTDRSSIRIFNPSPIRNTTDHTVKPLSEPIVNPFMALNDAELQTLFRCSAGAPRLGKHDKTQGVTFDVI
jgi:uncharacterized membrane-anchored protein YhcB (DUF1043 family)